MERAERRAQQEHLLHLRDEAEAELSSIPGVASVGVGLKEIGGQLTDQIVFRVYVRQKRPLDEVAPSERIPSEIRGVSTDVLNATIDGEQDDTSKYRPIRGGVQVGNGSGGVGTLGCLAKRNDDWVILSNHHVLFSGDKTLADVVTVGQPDYISCCCCGCNEIATVVDGSKGGTVDCAIATIDSDVTKVHEIVDVGAVAGTDDAVVGDVVRKRGRSTGLTEGEIIDVAYVSESSAGTLTDQLRIAPGDGFDRWSNNGDSGSAVVNEDDKVVGLHCRGSDGHGTANKIANVMNAVHIVIPAALGDAEDLGAVGAAHRADRPAEPTADKAAWNAVADRLLYDDAPLGRLLRRHRHEVWALLQERRAVTVIWHRRHGPAFAAAFHRTATTPGYLLPDHIHNVSFAGLLMSMAAALEEHGSPLLQRDVRRFAAGWINRVQGCRTAQELLDQLDAINAELEENELTHRSVVGR